MAIVVGEGTSVVPDGFAYRLHSRRHFLANIMKLNLPEGSAPCYTHPEGLHSGKVFTQLLRGSGTLNTFPFSEGSPTCMVHIGKVFSAPRVLNTFSETH